MSERDERPIEERKESRFKQGIDRLPQFRGDKESAALLLECLQFGMEYIQKKAAEIGINTRPFTMSIDISNKLPAGTLPNYSTETDAIIINQAFLEKASAIDPRYLVTIKYDQKGKGQYPYREITIPHYFMLSGVKFAHFSLFHRQNPDYHHRKPTELAIENAGRVMDFGSLKWQRQFAHEHNLPQPTQTCLDEQYECAKISRRARAEYKLSQVKSFLP